MLAWGYDIGEIDNGRATILAEHNNTWLWTVLYLIIFYLASY